MTLERSLRNFAFSGGCDPSRRARNLGLKIWDLAKGFATSQNDINALRFAWLIAQLPILRVAYLIEASFRVLSGI